MNPLLKRIEELSHLGSAFADVRIQQGLPIAMKTPLGWMDVMEEGATDPSQSGVSRHDIAALLEEIDPNWKSLLEVEKKIDRAITLGKRFRLRIAAYSLNAGTSLGMVIRIQDAVPVPIEESGLPFQITQMAEQTSGLILVCGPTGSGKTTTLACMADYINRTRTAHIVTIEEPIEYLQIPNKSMFTQREVGVDTNSFSDGVIQAMRQAPDVIIIGEIRDRDTCEAALRAALSGHLVLASTHGARAVGAIQRMFSYFPEEPGFVSLALQSALVGAVAQVLLPSVDGVSFVVATEVLAGKEQLVQDAIGDPSKLAAIDERLLKGAIKGQSSHFNVQLRQLVRDGKVAEKVALAASPAVLELAKALQPGSNS